MRHWIRSGWFAVLMVIWGLVLVFLAWFVLSKPARAESAQLYTRVTFYYLSGRMASGESVHAGAAACSDWLPFGTLLEFEDGRTVECLDRGKGDSYWNPTKTGHDAWVDVWVPTYGVGIAQIERSYGLSATLTVTRWGRGDE